MADDFGRVNPVSQHFLARGAREEPYQGRHPKKHPGEEPDGSDGEVDASAKQEVEAPPPGNHIDLRI